MRKSFISRNDGSGIPGVKLLALDPMLLDIDRSNHMVIPNICPDFKCFLSLGLDGVLVLFCFLREFQVFLYHNSPTFALFMCIGRFSRCNAGACLLNFAKKTKSGASEAIAMSGDLQKRIAKFHGDGAGHAKKFERAGAFFSGRHKLQGAHLPAEEIPAAAARRFPSNRFGVGFGRWHCVSQCFRKTPYWMR